MDELGQFHSQVSASARGGLLFVPPKSTQTAWALSKAIPGRIRSDGVVAGMPCAQLVPFHSQVSGLVPDSPPKSTQTPRPLSKAIAPLALGGGEVAGNLRVQLTPFHSQVSAL